MDERIEKYLDSVVPEKFSKRRKALIREELETHISEHIDFYTEIGYGEDESIGKALADMGDDGGVTDMVKKGFEKVYGEKPWVPILVAVLNVVALAASLFLGVWILSADSKGRPDTYQVFISFIMVFAASLGLAAAYRFGYKYTLLSIGIPNGLAGATLIFSGYPQPAVYAALYDMGYIIEKLTPLSMNWLAGNNVMLDPEYLSFIVGVVFDIGVAVMSVILFARLKKKEEPEKNGRKGLIISACVLAAVSVAFTLMYSSSYSFFRNYTHVMRGYEDGVYYELQTYDGICSQSEAAFELIELGMSYDLAKQTLAIQGYMPFDEYCETQSRGMRKRLKYSFGELELPIKDEGYEVFINRFVFYNPGEVSRNCSNGFVYLKMDEDGCVGSKGVGSGANIIRSDSEVDRHFYGEKGTNGRECFLNFNTLKAGDDRDEVIKKIVGDEGEIFAKFFTLKNGEMIEYYRVDQTRRSYDKEKDRNLCPVVVELWFENEKLSDAKLYRLDSSLYEYKLYKLDENVQQAG